MLLGTPPGKPPDRGMKIQLQRCYVPTPLSHLLKMLYDGELTELCSQQIDMLDYICIQLSMAAHWQRRPRGQLWWSHASRTGPGDLLRLLWQKHHHAASGQVTPSRVSKQCSTTCAAMCRSRVTKLDLASRYYQLQVRVADQWRFL